MEKGWVYSSKKYILTTFLLFHLFLPHLTAQNETLIDSLENVLSRELPDSTRLLVLDQLSFQSCFSNLDKAFLYAEKYIEFAQTLNNSKNEGHGYYNKAVAYSIKGVQDSAAITMEIALKTYEDIQDSLSMAKTLNGLGNIYRAQGNLPVALDYFLGSLVIKEQFLPNRINQDEIAGSYIGIGSVFVNLESNQEAIDYFLKALTAFEESGNLKGIAASATNLAYAYRRAKDFEKALSTIQKALTAEQKGGNKEGMTKVHTNMGNTYLDLNNLDSAAVNFEKAIELMEEIKQDVEKSEPLLGLAKLSYTKGNLTQALELAQKAITLAEKGKMLKVAFNTRKLLADIYQSQGDFQNAYQNFQTYTKLSDSLLNEENQKKIIRLETQYAYEKREKQLRLEQAEKEFQLQQRNQRNLYILYSAILVLIFVGVLAVLYYRYSQQLRQLNATKDKLFTIIAHDLKNPLSAFRSITQSLSSNLNFISKDEIQYFLEKLNKSSYQLFDLLQNLLQWAITQSGQFTYQPKSQNIYATSLEIVNQLSPNVDLKEQTLKNAIPEHLNAYYDAKMTALIFRNLISNAIKFTPNQGEIELFTKENGNFVHISVKDNGVGISPTDQKKLFKVEEDNNNIGSSPEKGTGLGLILCKELVEKQGGKIWVESTPDQGASFTFSLPKSR